MNPIALAWCDDGLSRHVWRLCCLILRRGQLKTFPPPGFVGRVSGSFRGTVRLHVRACSLVRLPLNPSISHARLWRLTYELGTPQPAQRPSPSGGLSDPVGKSREDDGEDVLHLPIQTISISGQLH